METPKENDIVILSAKSKKGKDRINEQGKKWKVEAISEKILFDTKPGPWLGLRATKSKEFFRWVHLTDDENFEVHEHLISVTTNSEKKPKMKNCADKLESFVKWYASMNIISYKNSPYFGYVPNSEFHYYLAGSPKRFTETELISIYINDADDVLADRWHEAIADNIKHLKKYKTM